MSRIRISEKKGITILYLEGRIDINSSEIIETAGRLLRDNKTKLIINLADVDFIDYSGLSILAITYKKVENYNGTLKFCNLKLHIKELLKTVRLDRVFECYETEEDAIMSFDQKISEIARLALRRKFQRTETHIDVKFRNISKTDDKEYTGRILNMSGAGAYIFTQDVFPVRTKLKMQITLPREIAPLDVNGEVIWVADKQLQPHDYPGMGVQFIDIDSDLQKEIIEFVERNITHRSEMGNV